MLHLSTKVVGSAARYFTTGVCAIQHVADADARGVIARILQRTGLKLAAARGVRSLDVGP